MKIKRFNRTIYSEKGLKATAAAYKSIAEIRIRISPTYADVLFTNCKYDEERTVCEFENYLIAVENS